MPNHVENHLTFDCSEERLKEILQAIGRDEDSALDGQYGIGTFDFNKVIPMPDDIYRGDLGPKEQKIYGKKNWYDWSSFVMISLVLPMKTISPSGRLCA